MILDGGRAHLTYCSNIHPGETWAEVRANLERYVPSVRDQVAPGQPFGVGLRLSAQAASDLSRVPVLEELRDFLARNDLYVFTVNGFPYGKFHGARVKEGVYLPDWRNDERLRYTDELADLLAKLLPDGLQGSVSTVPGAFKPAVQDERDAQRIAENLYRHVAHLVELKRRTGRHIALALEPEPCCYLETVDETVEFFNRYLFRGPALAGLSELTGLSKADAATAMHDHIGVCLDLCHAAVEFEDPVGCVKQLQAAGIGIPKMQISSGLRLAELSTRALDGLRQFDDPVYLHQVVETGPDGLTRYLDLPQAMRSLEGRGHQGREWRVHCHVPVFLDDLGYFSSTQAFIRDVLRLHNQAPVSDHLEVETYTWNVLPEHLRAGGMDQAIARELTWVREELSA
jgi:sugar phosphate isomerase/epimerase